MNCFRSIYFFIVLLLLMGLVVIFHANMMLIYFQEEDSFNLKFKSLSLKQNPPNINRMLLFDRLISFFNLFKSKIPPAKEADKLLKFIEKRFPTIFNCEYIQISKFNSTLLFEVQGNKSKQGSQSDNPFLVGLDLDSDSILDGWSMHHPHFQVDYINEAITGIGATSSKSLVMSMMEALNMFIDSGQRPSKSFYILFLKDGNFFDHCSSEIVVEYFEKQNVHFDFVLEIPGVILNNTLPGLQFPVAVIGTSRKGYIAMELSINRIKMPNFNLNSFPLTSAILAISSSPENNFGQGIELAMISNMSQFASYPYNLVYTNLWFFKPFLTSFMGTNGYWQNVIKTKTKLCAYHFLGMTEASAIVEQETHQKVNVYEQKETNQKIAEQHETNVRIYDIYQPKSAFYEYRTAAYQAIKNSIRMTFPNSVVIPGDCLMHSHLRHFESISDYIYQFSPTIFTIDGIESYYTNSERLTLTRYLEITKFYFNLFVVTTQT